MDKKELQKELEWAKKQSKEMKFTLPEREPDEPPATETQIRYLKTLTRDLDENEIRKLGMKQIASLIDQVKMEQEMFTDELVAKRLAEKSGCLSTILLVFVLFTLFCLLW